MATAVRTAAQLRRRWSSEGPDAAATQRGPLGLRWTNSAANLAVFSLSSAVSGGQGRGTTRRGSQNRSGAPAKKKGQ